jgi:hypothetical protein
LLTGTNRKANVVHRHAQDYKINNVECLLVINSLCKGLNYKLPFTDASGPSRRTDLPAENLGFDSGLGEEFEDGELNHNDEEKR